jgi:hypothetical protein
MTLNSIKSVEKKSMDKLKRKETNSIKHHFGRLREEIDTFYVLLPIETAAM